MFENIRKSLQEYFGNYGIRILYIVMAVLAGILLSISMYPYGNSTAITNKETYINTIPYNDIHFGSGTFSLNSLKNTTIVSQSGYGYIPKIRAEFDMSGLSEKDRYWIVREGNLQFDCSISSEMNGIENMEIVITSVYFNDEKLYLEFTGISKEEWRYPFDDMLVTLRFSVIRDKKENVTYEDITVTKYDTDNYVFVSDPNSQEV